LNRGGQRFVRRSETAIACLFSRRHIHRLDRSGEASIVIGFIPTSSEGRTEVAVIEKLRKVVTGKGATQRGTVHRDDNRAPASARDAFFQVVEQVAYQDRLPFHAAMAEVRVRRPDLFVSAFPASRAVRRMSERELLAA
jgi:hypothetical protein